MNTELLNKINNLPTSDGGIKYPRGTLVFIGSLPQHKRHFTQNTYAVVEGTYASMYGGKDNKDYSLVVLDENLNAINRVAWYHESELDFICSDVGKGLGIIEQYYNKM